MRRQLFLTQNCTLTHKLSCPYSATLSTDTDKQTAQGTQKHLQPCFSLIYTHAHSMNTWLNILSMKSVASSKHVTLIKQGWLLDPEFYWYMVRPEGGLSYETWSPEKSSGCKWGNACACKSSPHKTEPWYRYQRQPPDRPLGWRRNSSNTPPHRQNAQTLLSVGSWPTWVISPEQWA